MIFKKSKQVFILKLKTKMFGRLPPRTPRALSPSPRCQVLEFPDITLQLRIFISSPVYAESMGGYALEEAKLWDLRSHGTDSGLHHLLPFPQLNEGPKINQCNYEKFDGATAFLKTVSLTILISFNTIFRTFSKGGWYVLINSGFLYTRHDPSLVFQKVKINEAIQHHSGSYSSLTKGPRLRKVSAQFPAVSSN